MRSYVYFVGMCAAGMLMFMSQALAGDAAVLDVTARANDDGTYAFTATVAHHDEGWSHYATKWEVLGPDGKILGTRELFHPHVGETTFTRSLGRVVVPIGVTQVTVQAFDNVHGAGTRTFTVDLPPRK